MKQKNIYQAILLVSTAVTGGVGTPAIAQEKKLLALEEVVVTARRREERLQDVPVSMTVFNQEQLSSLNVVNAADIATYTPSLMANNRFGDDSSNFAIRGFSQELRTTSSVGVYFAEVVAPRGANTTQSGDGAGPGDFFDLANVQVLKGPQGTLFGRNTTGGAVLLTPVKPTDALEGYAEFSIGNYDMRRSQGVLNIPFGNNFRVRLGIDQQKRDGYLDNISYVGPDEFANLDYTSMRASAVWDITDRVENYTIFKYSESSNNGAPFQVFGCNTELTQGFGPFCRGDLEARAAIGGDGEFDVYNFVPDPQNDSEQTQVINTTTWQITDKLTIKNILSYGEFESRSNYPIYGTNWRFPPGNPEGQPIQFQMVGARGFPTTDQKTWIEEFQLQGFAFNDRLNWQAGIYYEKSEPKGVYGSLNPSQISCDMSTVASPNPADWRCNDILAAAASLQRYLIPRTPNPRLQPDEMTVGSFISAPGEVTYENKAIYFQATYDLSDFWSITAGLRYTDDETSGWTEETVYYFPGRAFSGEYYPYYNTSTEERRPETSSEEPTWLLGVDYKPFEGVLLYGKYSRGYRQGSVNLASVAEWDTHEPEKVDTYEIGAKTSFDGAIPGTFNISAFYNDFQNQQVQFGYFRTNGVGTTSILNAGASTIWGVEIDTMLRLTDQLTLTASYAYLNTNVDDLEIPAEYPDQVAIFAGTSTAEGEPLPYTPEHQVVVSANWLLPLDPAIGDVSAIITFVYTDEMQAVSRETSIYAVLPSYELVNASINWQNIYGSSVDASLFVTNLFEEEYITNVAGNWATAGFEVGRTGKPRMWGARLRYNF